MRESPLITNEYYHIFNRGVDKRNIFLDQNDFVRFLTSMREFNVQKPIGSIYKKDWLEKKKVEKGTKFPIGNLVPSSPLVEIICYCLNPNHFHFVLKQLVEDGISRFMHKLSLGYTNYFNTKYKRSGSLFQGPFKAVHIESNEHLLWVSAYVNTNAEIHNIAVEAIQYPWCSYSDYLGLRKGTLCEKSVILGQIKNIAYKDFVEKTIPLIKEKKEAVKYLVE